MSSDDANGQDQPALTVVVALQNARRTVTDCLQSWADQAGLQPGALEMIVVDHSTDGSANLVERHFPVMTLIRAPQAASLPRLHGLGIERSRGRLVALTEGHCTVPPTWATEAIRCHDAMCHGDQAAVVIGGPVEPGRLATGLAWALYLVDYGQFMLPLAAGPSQDLPGNNVIFNRPALASTTDLARSGFWKTFHCHQLANAGATLALQPNLPAYYHRAIGVRATLRRRYRHGRCFGAMRSASLAGWRRLAYALLIPLLPGLLLARTLQRCWSKGRHRRRLLRSLPWLLLLITIWLVGEWAGTLWRDGGCCDDL